MRIIDWLASGDTGASSKSIAFAASGAAFRKDHYPCDNSDFGRCYRLLQQCPDAKDGLEKLSKDGCDEWKALISRWSDIEAAYLADTESGKGRTCYDLIQSIVSPIEDASGKVIRFGKGTTIRFA